MKKNTPLLTQVSNQEANQIASRIKYLRCELLRMTQTQFANTIHISQTYLSMLEKAEKPITDTFIHNITSYLGVNPEWLLFGADENEFINGHPSIENNIYNSLSDLQIDYKLSDSEIDFIRSFLNLSHGQREKLVSALKIISDIKIN